MNKIKEKQDDIRWDESVSCKIGDKMREEVKIRDVIDASGGGRTPAVSKININCFRCFECKNDFDAHCLLYSIISEKITAVAGKK